MLYDRNQEKKNNSNVEKCGKSSSTAVMFIHPLYFAEWQMQMTLAKGVWLKQHRQESQFEWAEEADKKCCCYLLVTKLCLTLCNPMDCSLPGSSILGIFQARVLGWVAISSSRKSSWPRDRTCISCGSRTGRHILDHCGTWEALLVVLCPICNVSNLPVPQLLHL